MNMLIQKFKKSNAARFLRYVRMKYYRTFYKSPNYVAHVPKQNEQLIAISDKQDPTFFGYHDKTPFNKSNNKVLAMSVDCDDTDTLSEGRKLHIGYFTIGEEGELNKTYKKIAETQTWCWQQGCMLQWNPAKPDREIIYNSFVNKRYGSIKYDVVDKKILSEYPEPIYSLSPVEEKAVTLNMSRLGRLRPGYGYNQISDDTEGISAPESDGLFIFDLQTEQKTLAVSIKELEKEVKSDALAEHYVNHATFSNKGTKVAFFHLWSLPGDKNRNLRFLFYDLSTNKVKMIEDDRTVSHYCWRNDDELLATTRDSNGNWYYSLYNLVKNSRTDLPVPLKVDGHPMFHPTDKDVIVTDTYPDKRNDQHLCIVNIKTGDIKELGAFHSPFRYKGQVRCDLHPRWDRNGDYVVVDTTNSGSRKMNIVEVDR